MSDILSSSKMTMVLLSAMFLTVLWTTAITSNVVKGESLRLIEDDFWQWRLEQAPEFASSVGITTYNDKLASYNVSVFESRRMVVEGFLERLLAVDFTWLDKAEQLDYQILSDHLQTYLDGFSWRFYETLNPINFLEGLQTNPAHFLETLPFKTDRDYENYLRRLHKLPKQLAEFRYLFSEAVRRQHTLHRVSVEPVPGQIEKLLVDDVTQSTFYSPFRDMSSVSPVKRDEIREKGRQFVNDVIEAFRTLKNYIINEYLPHARSSWGIGQWDNGIENYKACLRWHLSLDITPEYVHRLGLSEVARIRRKMEQTMSRMNFNGTISDFFNVVRTDPRFHVTSGQTLLQKYNDIIYNEIYPKLPRLFKDIPNLPLRTSPMPNDGVGGEYLAGTADGARPGIFYINLFHPNEIATIDMKALSLHETVPGHHLQRIYALAADLPSFRKFQEDTNYWQAPFKFPFYTAYLEGWALYAEYLGEEMGLYKDDYELMGRYGSEMFRASRMVVDTGLHYFNWDKEQAVSYMLAHTAYSRNDIESEVHRYVTWPGQACSYKIGEIRIRQLRERAMQRLGPLFDLKTFHALLLKNGPVPLRILERMVNEWMTDVTSELYQG
ncbi:uncharacterized protein LOC124131352 isoform X1 [Haliotis rufescens]|uniref:uncharacterized protein LOC124131352 isoform X1 n=2 Tax=Haliotis rufescens TaxID=6454 RepID=UPI001EAF9BB2|nr:uncharacterized protein LOC124131352 isoform X1 [Haliotis rufescens]